MNIMLDRRNDNQTYLGWDISWKHDKFQNPARIPKNGPQSNQRASYRKIEVIQSHLRIWGTCEPIESDSSDPKNGGYIGVV